MDDDLAKHPRYFAGARAFADRDVIRPGESASVAIVEEPGAAWPVVGTAHPHLHLRGDDERRIPPEAGWRLVVRGAELPGVWVLRKGQFIELG